MTDLEALERRLAVDKDWLVPWQMTLAPRQLNCREAMIRLILPARILRKVKYGKRLDEVTNSSEFSYCIGPVDGWMQARTKEAQPKYWIDLIILALERTGYITKEGNTYAITAKGRVWLRMTVKFSLPPPSGSSGTEFDWTWRLWFPKPSRDPLCRETLATSHIT
jgi:hypothetical protein